MQHFAERLFSRRPPHLDWIQVEVSSYCNASCSYCPSTLFHEYWQRRHLSLELYRRILPAFARADMVHLQGWGEPLLNSNLPEMIVLAKARGCRVGTTTNGTLADKKILEDFINTGLDFIAFSLAGTNSENDRIRAGTHLDLILQTIETLQMLKREKNTPTPEIHIAYLLLRSHVQDVTRLPFILKDSGVRQVVISTLDFNPGPEFAQEIFTPDNTDFRQLLKLLKGVVTDGARLGIPVHFQVPARAP